MECKRCKRGEVLAGKVLCERCSGGRKKSTACSGCGRPFTEAAASLGYRGKCKECATKDKNKRRKKYRANGLCFNCGSRPVVHGRILCQLCRDKLMARRNRQRLADKKAAFAAYGGEHCSCCGERHFEFLTIDHINGDGGEHRKVLKAEGDFFGIYQWLKRNKYPSGFRVLCMNCNWSLGVRGYCPHKPPG